MIGLELIFTDSAATIGVWKHVGISVWHGSKPQKDHFEALVRCYDLALAYSKDRLTTLQVITDVSVPKLTDADRQSIRELQTKYGPKTMGAAQIVEAGGLRGTAARAFLTGISVVSATPTKTVATVDDGAAWLVSKASDLGTAAELAQAVADLRRRGNESRF